MIELDELFFLLFLMFTRSWFRHHITDPLEGDKSNLLSARGAKKKLQTAASFARSSHLSDSMPSLDIASNGGATSPTTSSSSKYSSAKTDDTARPPKNPSATVSYRPRKQAVALTTSDDSDKARSVWLGRKARLNKQTDSKVYNYCVFYNLFQSKGVCLFVYISVFFCVFVYLFRRLSSTLVFPPGVQKTKIVQKRTLNLNKQITNK